MSIDRQDVKHFSLIFGLGALLCAGVWVGLRQMHAGLDEKAAGLQKQLGLTQGSDSIQRLQDQVGLLETAFTEQPSQVPERPETGAVHAAVSNALKDLNVTSQEITTDPAETFRRFGVVPVRVVFESDFPSIHRFVDRIEAADRLIGIERLEIETDPRRAGRLRASLELRAYYASDETLAAAETTP